MAPVQIQTVLNAMREDPRWKVRYANGIGTFIHPDRKPIEARLTDDETGVVFFLDDREVSLRAALAYVLLGERPAPIVTGESATAQVLPFRGRS